MEFDKRSNQQPDSPCSMELHKELHQADLQLQPLSPQTQGTHPSSQGVDPSVEWMSAFNTSLLTTRANHTKDRAMEIAELMQTPEFASILVGAQHLAESQDLSKEEATERLIEVFRKIDSTWKQIVMKRGLQALIE